MAHEPSTDENLVVHWLDEIIQAEKREKLFREEGVKTVRLYESRNERWNEYNILYANTETLSPALYSTTPRPRVQRRYKDEDPLGKEVSLAIQRVLEFALDDGTTEYESFNTLMKCAVLDALVPGRGITRFKYDAYIIREEQKLDSDEPLPGKKLTDEAPQPDERIGWETVCGQSIPWNHFIHGYGRTWQQVPWIAYYHYLTKEELQENFGIEVAARVSLTKISDQGKEDEKTIDDRQSFTGALVYEIWDKKSKKVLFVSPGYKDGPLRELDDPLQLKGFFNCPEPLTFFQPISSMTPVALFNFYKDQAKELNMITSRINRVIHAMKVRGVYDGSLDGFERLFDSDDNEFIALPNSALMSDGRNLDNAIWMMPIDTLAAVLQQLYLQREQIKKVIYEIVGISDIIRGSSRASETAAAQQIKDKWGTLRLNRLQQEVMRYARDSLRIMAEIASRFSEETFRQMTGLPYLTSQEKQMAQQIAQTALPTLPPEQQAEIQAQLEAPSWGEIIAVLQDDLQRQYRIDIETNSTVSPDATEDKEHMAEFMNAMSQFLLGVQPLIENGTMPFEAAKAILMTMVRKYQFGTEVEDELRNIQAPQPPQGEGGDTAQAEADLERQRMELESQQAQLQAAQEKIQLDAERQIQQLQMEAERNEMRRQQEHQRLMLQLEKQRFDLELARMQMQAEEQIRKAVGAMEQKQQQQPSTTNDQA